MKEHPYRLSGGSAKAERNHSTLLFHELKLVAIEDLAIEDQQLKTSRG
jgi:hypothetical protein